MCRPDDPARPSRSRRRVVAAVGGFLVLAGLAIMPGARAAETLNVVATTAMIGDVVANLAGDRAAVTVLMGPGVDPHAYRQTRSDVVRLGTADAIFHNGLYLEAQLDDLLHRLSREKPTIAVSDGIARDRLLAHDTYKDKFDPHVWMDPAMWAGTVATVRDALIALDPAGEALFRANADAYVAELAALAGYAERVLATVPDGGRVLVTAHDAFNYFGRAYDFEVVGIQGISTESEAGLQQIERLVDLIVARGVEAVFVESSVAPRNVRALVEGARARGADITIGGELFSDAMGRPGTYEGTYLGMIDHNVTVITRALGGDAPAEGRLGRLAGS